jgi:hypothetical protein
MSSSCRSCKAPIVWARTEAGKNMPLDANPTTGAPAIFVDGNVEITGHTGNQPLVKVHGTPADGLSRSHFASCPNRAQHRR